MVTQHTVTITHAEQVSVLITIEALVDEISVLILFVGFALGDTGHGVG